MKHYAIKQDMFKGPVDVVGDIHGEIEALRALLAGLGYDAEGNHPEGRRLIFIGDLVDRGPDSPAVLKLVKKLVESYKAQCVLGNHELNLLRGDLKHGNSWWVDPNLPLTPEAARVDDADREELRTFLLTLPLALERDDLRVVHACWQTQFVDELNFHFGGKDPLAAYDDQAKRAVRELNYAVDSEELKREYKQYGHLLADDDWFPVLLPAMAQADTIHQMRNRVRVLTSGVEEPAVKPFWAGGRWRMVSRVKWWESYQDDKPVIFGHYWRRFDPHADIGTGKYGPDLMEGYRYDEWMGKRRNAYCVDFSVGARSVLRDQQRELTIGKLAAIRVPEWEVVCDDGSAFELGPPQLTWD